MGELKWRDVVCVGERVRGREGEGGVERIFSSHNT